MRLKAEARGVPKLAADVVQAKKSPGVPEKPAHPLAVIAFLIFIIGGPIYLWIQAKNAPKVKEPEPVATYSTVAFEVGCRSLIRDQLKSPATAEFEDTFASNSIQTLPVGYFWPGWVDSQNSFGALIRTKFKCVWDKKTDELTTKILP